MTPSTVGVPVTQIRAGDFTLETGRVAAPEVEVEDAACSREAVAESGRWTAMGLPCMPAPR